MATFPIEHYQMACQMIEKFPDHERIAFVFDRNKQLGVREGGRADQLYSSLINGNWQNLKYIHRLGGITFEDKARILALQAADYLAYENFKYLNEVVYGEKPERWQWTLLRRSLHHGRILTSRKWKHLWMPLDGKDERASLPLDRGSVNCFV